MPYTVITNLMNIAGFSNTNNNSNKKQDLITRLTSGSPLLNLYRLYC